MGGVHTAYKRDDRRELNGRQILPGDVAGPGGALPPSARGQQARGEVAGRAGRAVPGVTVSAEEAEVLRRKIETLRARLSGLSEATLRITRDLDLSTVLQGVIDEARALTDARYGALLVLDRQGGIEEFATSGITPEQRAGIKDYPKVLGLLQHLNEIEGPLRLGDIASHPNSVGFPEGHPPMKSFLGAPIFHRGQRLGNIYLTEKESTREFTAEDEEILTVFASHAAVAISNARSYLSERRAKADLEALVDTSPVGVLVFDARTMDLLSFNQETRRIVRGLRGLGHRQEGILSAITCRYPNGQRIPTEDLPAARAIRSGETVRADEVIMELPDGQAVTVIINATPVFSEEGEVVSCITTMQDMTALERIERLRSEFVGMVGHELRTPLAAIKGSAASVLGSSSPLDNAEMRRFFQVIDEQADQMRSLIGDILETAQMDAGTLSVTTAPADVAGLVEEARGSFLRGGTTNVIEVDLPPGLPPVSVDRQRMLQVLNNLFTYASINSPYGSTIRVSASVDDVHVSVSVTDEGKGVSAERLPHMFRKFSPSDPEDGYEPALARKPGPTALTAGEGLGLVICRGIVEAHGGRIWAESDGRGRGTRITFTVPTVQEAVPSRLGGDPELTPYRGAVEAERGRERILIVDDEPHQLLYLRKTLREAGYTPLSAADPRGMERVIETDRPHLVLLNPSLAGPDPLSGRGADIIEMIDGVRELTDAPVIFLSEQGGDGDVARAFDVGADDYIVRPFSPTELVTRIRAALRRQTAPERERTRQSYRAGDLTIDYAERRVTVAERPVQLTSTEYRLLFDLSVNAGRVLSHDQLLKRVWGPGYEGDTQPVRTFVKSLRRKLGDDARSPAYIFTEPRVGYRMAKPEAAAMRAAQSAGRRSSRSG